LKKLLLILILLQNILFAENNYELKLFEKVLPAIFKIDKVLVYADADAKNILQNSSVLVLTNDCNKATLLLGKKFDNLDNSCIDKPLFATSYRSFKNEENSFGAFYWRKGRPQIKFEKSNLEKFNLDLPVSLRQYL